MKALEIHDLKKTYTNGLEALKGISLSVEEGEFVALLGPNGAGKSTTISILCSLVQKTAGKVSICGYDIDTDFPLAKQQLGIVPQEFNFNSFEKVEDILVTQAGYYGVPAGIARKRAEQYMEQLGLLDKRNTVARMLSGGMKRRLMIARALVHEPRILVLDEPTAGVDIELRRSMWQFLKDKNAQGTTIILTTHYLEEAEALCKRVAIIDKGNLVADMNTRDLLKRLQIETFVLDLATPLPADFSLPGYEAQAIDSTTLEVTLDKQKQQTANELFADLSAKNIVVQSLRNKANRLEELFVRILAGKEESTL
ncbi:MAG TPA: ABC transporter ATP-binding protein [Pseudomonadales bacterium]